MAEQYEVFAAIDGERDYQYDRWTDECAKLDIPYRPDTDKTVGEWLVYIKGYYNDAFHSASHYAGCSPMDIWRKLAALCVACMEVHGAFDRYGKFYPVPITRSLVYQVIKDERNYQDRLGPDRTDGSDHNSLDFLVMFDTYLRQAIDAWTMNPGTDEALNVVRKLAAIAVHCMERNGVVNRIPYDASDHV